MCLPHTTISLSTSAFSTPTRTLVAKNNKHKLVTTSTANNNNNMSLPTHTEEASHISPDWNSSPIYQTPIASIQKDSPPEMPSFKRIIPAQQRVLDFDLDDEKDFGLSLSLPNLERMIGSRSSKRSMQDEIFIPCKLSSERMGFRPRIHAAE